MHLDCSGIRPPNCSFSISVHEPRPNKHLVPHYTPVCRDDDASQLKLGRYPPSDWPPLVVTVPEAKPLTAMGRIRAHTSRCTVGTPRLQQQPTNLADDKFTPTPNDRPTSSPTLNNPSYIKNGPQVQDRHPQGGEHLPRPSDP